MPYTVREIEEINERVEKMEHCFGPSSFLFPSDVDGSRLNMGTQNMKQFVCPIHPEIPRVSTGHENKFGQISHAYKQLKGDWKVTDKITKFDDDRVYTLVLYQKSTDTFDMVEKISATSINEKFGYGYNTEFMDSLNVGDQLEDPIIYKSTSYDKNMNYCLGKNARTLFTTDTGTYEDGIKIRKGFIEQFGFYEVDTTNVPINNNDVLLFMYGDKTFPDVGEDTKGNDILCATRRINNTYVISDFLEKNAHQLFTTDSDYHIKANSVVYDIDVYYNGDEPFPDTIFYKQLKYYYDHCCDYADKVFKAATEIKNSGSKYTTGVTLLRKRFKNFNNPEYKWKTRDKAFSNIEVIFKTRTTVIPTEGCKLVGRYGDKGVISTICDDTNDTNAVSDNEFSAYSKLLADVMGIDVSSLSNTRIVDDESMYFYYDGKGEKVMVDICLNAPGAFRRINTGQLYEDDLTFAAERIREWICTLDNDDTKIKEIFDFLKMVNMDQAEYYISRGNIKVPVDDDTKTYLLQSDDDFKHKFVESVEKDGFYFVKPPDSEFRYRMMTAIYDKYQDIIKPYTLYVNMFGMTREVMREAVVGYKYMFLLKQTSNKNYSVRSTGKTTKAGLPAKSSDKKENRRSYSNTPIALSEINNISSQISMLTLAVHNILTRTSTIGRKELGKILNSPGNPIKVRKFAIKQTFTNVPVFMMMARLKVMGLGYKFVTPKTIAEENVKDTKVFLSVYDYTFFDSPANRPLYLYLVDRYNELVRKGYTPHSAEVWEAIMDLEETKIIDIPIYIEETVKALLIGTEDTKPKRKIEKLI